jgi:hypothetical protein
MQEREKTIRPPGGSRKRGGRIASREERGAREVEEKRRKRGLGGSGRRRLQREK